MKLLRVIAKKLFNASRKVDATADKIQSIQRIPAKIREGYAHHLNMLRGALNNHVDEITVVADLDVREYKPLIKQRGSKLKGDKHIVKGWGFYVQNDNVHFILNNGCRCNNCGLVGSRLVLCTPLEKEEKMAKQGMGYLRCIGQIGDKWYQLTVDHIKPRTKGGSDDKRNKQVLCMVCNQVKDSYQDVIPFHSHIIPVAPLRTQLGMWINAAIKWHNIGGPRLTTIGS